MTAYDHLREGQLDEALAALQHQIRANPADAKLRVFLFQLLTVLGQWDRAQTQLNVVAEMDPQALAMAQTYRAAIQCELLRSDIFAGKRAPLVFGQPDQWIALLLEALRLTAGGKYDEAQRLRDQAFEEAPATAGSVTRRAAPNADEATAEPFAWIADADVRLGPVAEAIIDGRYYWVPLQHVQRLVIDPPEDLRDVVWMPAHFVWTNGGDTVALLPTRYPGSERSADASLRLSRKTDWQQAAPDVYFGLGQKMFTTDFGEFALMDVAEITFGQ